MLAFFDFEASSLGKKSYPIEVAWVFEDGASESYLIKPAPEWTDWDPAAQAIHGIERRVLEEEGEDYRDVAARMVEVLAGHDLLASAPSWDGKWLSTLLRAGGQPRRVLQLRDTDAAQLEAARACLAGVEPAAVREALAREVVGEVSQRRNGRVPDHRALADAEAELAQWLEVRVEAQRRAGSTCLKAPPRRRPGPNWERLVTACSASLLRPCHLGPGLRRGGCLRGRTRTRSTNFTVILTKVRTQSYRRSVSGSGS